MYRFIACFLLTLTTLTTWAARPIVEFITPSIVRVRWTPDGVVTDNKTDVCIYEKAPVELKYSSCDGATILQSDSLKVRIDKSGTVTFIDPSDGKVILTESPEKPYRHEKVAKEKIVYDEASAHMEETANGKVTVKDVISRDTLGFKDRYEVTFIADAGEAVYGLGSHMEDYMNLVGKTLWLTQHNLKAFIPVIISTGGYGLLFDAGCSMKYESNLLEGCGSKAACGAKGDCKKNNGASKHEMKMELEAANTIDYYFIKGDPGEVVAGYRYLTGNVGMMPRHLFGYIQSKERYVSSDDIVNTLKEFRRRQVPIDMIVQDWNYWPQGWGYMKMNREYYPDPKALADSVHAHDARLMVSIWANPQYCPEEEDFRKRGFMLEHSVYDAFNPAARNLYWDYANNEFFKNGFDAWWCDSSEPLDGDWNSTPEPIDGKPYSWNDHERRWRLNDEILSEALGAERACLYALNHARGIYEHQREASDEKRVINLTRSPYAGQQRYNTILWNGDTHASWESFRQQIPSGLNYFATGNPYWTVDVGCFFTKKAPRWFWIGEFPDGVKDDRYKEFYTRMFQWAAFLPVLRSHGTDTPREIWNFGEPGTPYYDAILKMINTRYSLIPYIYSLAALQSADSFTTSPLNSVSLESNTGYMMARPLAFDFPKDSNVYDIKDQYMFGDMMVCPVPYENATSRPVYLPDTDALWYDFWTGKPVVTTPDSNESGSIVTADAPLDTLPVFVKGGSIIPTVAPEQFSGAIAGKPITINVYPGADAEFTLYDDKGDGYGYEKGEWQRIRFNWNDAAGTLTIDDAVGSYPEAPAQRELNINLLPGKKSASKQKTVIYNGNRQVISLK